MYKRYGVKDPYNAYTDTIWDEIGPDNWDKAQAEYDSIYSEYNKLSRDASEATTSRIRKKYGNDYEKHEKAVVATVSAIGVLSLVTLVAIPVGLVVGGKALANKILG